MADTDTVPEARREEFLGVVEMLMSDAATPESQARPIAEAVAAASLRPGHLWRELELDTRAELRGMLEQNFPQFAAGNDRDMRWKKYIYRRLCGWPGFHG